MASRDRPAKSRVALNRIDDHLTFGAGDVWAWFVLPTQRWAFRSDADRQGAVLETATRLSGLGGRQLHLRVTSRPYPAAAWARGLDQRTPAPLPGVPGETWADHLVRAQRHVRSSTMAEKEIYLGVRLGDGGGVSSRMFGRSRGPARQKVDREAALVAEIVAGAGLGGRPARPRELEWLLHRSIGLGLPAPGSLSPVSDGSWSTEDLDEITDTVICTAEPFDQTVEVTRRGHGAAAITRHVAVLSVGRVEEIDVPDPAQDPWLAFVDRLPFPVEWSVRLDVLDGAAAAQAVQRKLMVIRDMQRHYREHELDEPLALERQASQARSIEDQMATGGDLASTRVHGWFRLGVSGATQEQCLDRVRAVIDAYRKRRVTVAHPKGQFALLREFVPCEPLATTAHRRRLPALYFAAGVPAAAATVGDRRGPYLGYTTAGARRAVMFDTHYSTEVRETSGLVPIVGALGSGKSVLAGLITYEAVRRGITSVMLDPSGPMANLCSVPELREHSRHIDLTTAPPGTLNPYAVVAQPRLADYPTRDALEEARTLAAQDRKLLALDVTTMLLPPALAAAPRTRMLLAEAVRETKGSPATSLWSVVELLERRDDGDAKDIAAYLRDMAELPLARLFFPVGPANDHQDVGTKTLTVLTMPGLVLPPTGVLRDHWSTSEQLAVPLLHLASWYASRSIYGRPRSERKLIMLDETHFLADWGAGRSLFTRLGRDSRKWNTCVLAASQNPGDVLGMEVSNFIAAAFVGRIEDEQVAADALRMLRVPAGVGYEAVLARLSPRDLRGARSGLREFVMRDVDGHVDRIRVDLDHLPQVLAALDTTATPVAGAPRDASALGAAEQALTSRESTPAGDVTIDLRDAHPAGAPSHSDGVDAEPVPAAATVNGAQGLRLVPAEARTGPDVITGPDVRTGRHVGTAVDVDAAPDVAPAPGPQHGHRHSEPEDLYAEVRTTPRPQPSSVGWPEEPAAPATDGGPPVPLEPPAPGQQDEQRDQQQEEQQDDQRGSSREQGDRDGVRV